MNSAVCTLFEGDYHYGVGALVNSLYKHGFRGVVWAGYRGALPPWAKDVQQHPQYQEFQVAEGCCIRFVPVNTDIHLANYKPAFILDLWDNYCPSAEEMFYFDPDIVIKCRWSFFEQWAVRGIALCQEIVNAYMPADHPSRLILLDFAVSNGHTKKRILNQYFNSGFVGLHQSHRAALCLWQELLVALRNSGVSLTSMGVTQDASEPFTAIDQDLLNLAAMIMPQPLSTIGPEGMDFIGGGFTMSHAAGGIKPWRKHMVREAFVGQAPTSADKGYWEHTQHPISLYSKQMCKRKKLELSCGSALGRFIRRS